jgi:hypothetical protein
VGDAQRIAVTLRTDRNQHEFRAQRRGERDRDRAAEHAVNIAVRHRELGAELGVHDDVELAERRTRSGAR